MLLAGALRDLHDGLRGALRRGLVHLAEVAGRRDHLCRHRHSRGRRWFPLWAVVRHRGRWSGCDYAIPVAVLVTRETFVIGLPWGPGTNRAQNVLAAKGCTIGWKAVDYWVTDPQIVGTDVALSVAGRLERVVIRRFGFPAFPQLKRTGRVGQGGAQCGDAVAPPRRSQCGRQRPDVAHGSCKSIVLQTLAVLAATQVALHFPAEGRREYRTENTLIGYSSIFAPRFHQLW